ncbi:hypothetical protein T492DRAFT_417800 [Pavlovales sp. CCMP2436]|nr:hypothetical protein T492DRAFT_417800 [Pavlovales sp. CCMP2436]
MRKNTPDLLYSNLHDVELRDRGKVAKNASTYPIKSGAELAAYLKQVGGGCELHFAFGPTEMACKQAHTERQLAETALRTAAAKVYAAELIAKTKLANANGPAGGGKAASKSTTDQDEGSEEGSDDEDGASASQPGRKGDGAALRRIRTLHVYPFYATQMEAKMGHYAITLMAPMNASDLTLSDLATQVQIYHDAHAFGMLPAPNIPPKLHALRRKTSGLTDTTLGTSLSLSSDADLAELIKQWLSDDGRLAFGVAVAETRGGRPLWWVSARAAVAVERAGGRCLTGSSLPLACPAGPGVFLPTRSQATTEWPRVGAR